MSDLTKQLNKLLKTKLLLAKESQTYPDKCILIDILIELVNTNYTFSQMQFNSFIDQASTFYNSYCFMASVVPEHQIITNYMLKTNVVTEEHIIKICNVISHKHYVTYCLDTLFEKKHNFTVQCFELLCKINFKYPSTYDYDTLHNNVIFTACTHITSSPNNKKFKHCLQLIEQNKNPFNIEYLEIILCCLSKYRNIKNKYVELKSLLDSLLENVNGDEIFQLIINKKITLSNPLYGIIIDYVVDKFMYNDIFVKYLVENIMVDNPEYLLKLMMKGFKPTVDILNMIIDKYVEEYLYLECDINYETIGLTKKVLEKCEMCENTPLIKMVDLFEIFKLNPNIATLNIACKHDQFDVIDILIDKYKIIPEKDTLDICIPTLNYELIQKILNYKIIPDKTTFYKFNENNYFHSDIRKVVELLINYGLIINFECVEHLLCKGTYLENLERFDINYDEKLYFVCYLNDNWPVEYKNKFTIDKVVLGMHNLCINKKLTFEKLINYLQTNNIKLDYYALDFLFVNNNCICDVVIKKYGCIPHMLTTYKYCEFPVNSYLQTIVKKYNIEPQSMLEQYDMVL